MSYSEHWSSLPYWDHLTDAQKSRVEAATVKRSFSEGTVLQGNDEGCLGLVYILKGAIRASLLSEEGREITLFRVLPDQACVLSASCVISRITFDTLLTTEGNTEVLLLNSAFFESLTRENIYIECFMYELATRRFSDVMWAMQQLLFTRFDCRLASFLLSKMSGTGSTTLLLTQEQVAREVNSAREVVARMLRRFAEEGLVAVKRGHILITDPDGLKKICEK